MTDFASVEELVRDRDRDRYLASLFVPQAQRSAVLSLYAFNVEITRIRDVTSEPLPGEVRLQWWRDLIGGEARGDAARHPIAAALISTIESFRLPRQPFLDLIDARVFDLYDDAMPTTTDLEGYCGETCSSLFRLASLILAREGEAGPPDAAGHAGVAYALAGLLRALPVHVARGQCYLPLDILSSQGASRDMLKSGAMVPPLANAIAEMAALARSHFNQAVTALRHAPPAIRPAFQPLALVPLWLGAIEKSSADLLKRPPTVSQWRRQWTLLRWRI